MVKGLTWDNWLCSRLKVCSSWSARSSLLSFGTEIMNTIRSLWRKYLACGKVWCISWMELRKISSVASSSIRLVLESKRSIKYFLMLLMSTTAARPPFVKSQPYSLARLWISISAFTLFNRRSSRKEALYFSAICWLAIRTWLWRMRTMLAYSKAICALLSFPVSRRPFSKRR